jgi:hypothetical protein
MSTTSTSASTGPRLVVLGAAGQAGTALDVACELGRAAVAKHPCEQCRCCACHKLCTKCRDHCSPMESCFTPVAYCPDFADMRDLRPVRYLYRSDYESEYRLRLPGTR